MRVFYSTDFPGHYPVGTAAIIVAQDKMGAYSLLLEKIVAMGFGDGATEFTVHEVPLDKAHAVVLNDGNY